MRISCDPQPTAVGIRKGWDGFVAVCCSWEYLADVIDGGRQTHFSSRRIGRVELDCLHSSAKSEREPWPSKWVLVPTGSNSSCLKLVGGGGHAKAILSDSSRRRGRRSVKSRLITSSLHSLMSNSLKTNRNGRRQRPLARFSARCLDLPQIRQGVQTLQDTKKTVILCAGNVVCR